MSSFCNSDFTVHKFGVERSMEDLLADSVFNGDREAQIQAASQFGKLSSKQKQKLVDRGVIVPLVSMLHSQDYEAIEAALLSLLSLAFGSERLVLYFMIILFSIELFKFGVIVYIVSIDFLLILQEQGPDCKIWSCASVVGALSMPKLGAD